MLLLIAILAVAADAQPGTVPRGDWPHEFRDGSNSGAFSPFIPGDDVDIALPISGRTPTLVWSAESDGGPCTGSASIDEFHDVIFGTQDGYLRKVDGATGEELWRYPAGASISSAPWVSDIWDGVSTAYVGDEAGAFHAVLVSSGAPKFAPFETERPITTSPFVRNHIAINGTTAYYSSGEQLLALNVRTWELRYNYTFPPGTKLFAPSYGYCTIYVASSNGTLLNMNPHHFPGDNAPTPEDPCCQELAPIKWAHHSSGPVAAASSGSVIVATMAGTVEQIRGLTGQVAWITTLPGAPSIRATPTAPLQSQCVFVGATDGVVYCLSTGEGEVLWSFATPAPIVNSAVMDTAGTLFVPVSNGDLYALDSGTGELLAVHHHPDGITNNPSISGLGLIIFGDSAGRMNAVSFA